MLDFFLYVIITIITPGPNTIMSMKNGLAYGFRRGIWFNFGHCAGFAVVMTLCLLFSKTLLAWLPQAKPVLLAVGVLYMLWQAYKCLTMTAISGSRVNEEHLPPRAFLVRQGFFLQFVNVKVILFGISVFSNYILNWSLSPAGQFGFCLVLAGIAFLCGILWLAGGTAMRRLFVRFLRPLGILMASALVYCAVRLVF